MTDLAAHFEDGKSPLDFKTVSDQPESFELLNVKCLREIPGCPTLVVCENRLT